MSCALCNQPGAITPARRNRICIACTQYVAGLAIRRDALWGTPVEPTLCERAGARAHLERARTLIQRSCFADAAREAGAAIVATDLLDPIVGEALKLLLTPPLLHIDGLAALRSRIQRRQTS